MIYGLLGIEWVIAGSVREEIWTWEGLFVKRNITNIISLTVFWINWKEKNRRIFYSAQSSLNRLKNKWIHIFGSVLLSHDILYTFYFKKILKNMRVFGSTYISSIAAFQVFLSF